MDRTFGDENAFTEGTVLEILSAVREKLRADDVAHANAEELAKREALEKLEKEREKRVLIEQRFQRKENVRKARIKSRAEKIAKAMMLVIKVLLLSIIVYLTYAISDIGPLNTATTSALYVVRIAALTIFLVLLILKTLNLVIGFMPNLFLDRFEPKLANWIERFFSMDDEER